MKQRSGYLPSSASLASYRRHTVVDEVHEMLLAAIVTGELNAGEVLHDQEWATRLDVSRTPIREAIKRLEGHGIVSVAAARYTRIASFTMEQARAEAKDWATIHRALACAVDPGAYRALHRDLEVLRERIREVDAAEYRAARFAFFERVREAAGSFSLQLGATAAAYRLQLALPQLPHHRGADDELCSAIVGALRAQSTGEVLVAFDRWTTTMSEG